jgi:hypothetical protein
MNEQVADEPFHREYCVTCGQHRPVCCGDFTNGFWCHECCPHPYDVDADDGYPYDEEDNEEFDCGTCGGAGGWHDCGEDTCCCADPDAVDDEWVVCPECGGASAL